MKKISIALAALFAGGLALNATAQTAPAGNEAMDAAPATSTTTTTQETTTHHVVKHHHKKHHAKKHHAKKHHAKKHHTKHHAKKHHHAAHHSTAGTMNDGGATGAMAPDASAPVQGNANMQGMQPAPGAMPPNASLSRTPQGTAPNTTSPGSATQ
jgi:hypothetical protein